MSAAPTILVEVCYAGPQGQWLRRIEVPVGTTLIAAIDASGLREEVPGLVVAEGEVGIFAEIRPFGTVLRAGDRVEIYRPLIADPKDARRARAARGR